MVANIYLATATLVADTFVSIASLVGLSYIKYFWKKSSLSIPVVFLSLLSVALVFSNPQPYTATHTASLSAAATLAIFTFAIHCQSASNNFVSLLHFIRAIRHTQNPILIPLPSAALACAIHVYFTWWFLDAQIKTYLIEHVKAACAVRGFWLAKLSKTREIEIDDIRDYSNESEFCEYSSKIEFDTDQKYFIIRGVIFSEWKSIAGFMVANTLIETALHLRRLAFVSIISAIGSSTPINYSSVMTTFIVWQLLSMATLLKRYVTQSHRVISDRIEKLIYAKSVDIYMQSHCDTYNHWDFESKISEISYGIIMLGDSISSTLAQALNVWIISAQVGWRVVIPIFVTLVQYSISQVISKKVEKLRKKQRATNPPKYQECFYTLFKHIRTIKFYGWEKAFMEAKGWHDKPRYLPPMFWRISNYLSNVIGSAISQIAGAFTIISFFGSTDKTLVYSDIALLMDSINSLTSFTTNLANIREMVTNIKKGMTLLQGLVDTEKKSFIVLEDQIPENNVVVDLKDCEFSWGKEKFSLKPITLTVKTGEFVTIVGRVGGGKSSFLSGLCGEMPVVGGEGRVCGKIGYVSQKPYILNETIRENVLIGAEYDEELFKKVIEASALSEDIAKFTLGDLSEIGFDGINLSGGQKVRLALARALYLQADIYIFDDLLSAVDARVERLIVDRVLSPAGIIGDKTRILVTHAEHLIPLSSRVITFTDGAVEIVDQQPSADFSASTALSSYDIEELSKGSGPLQEEDGKFTLHPELKNPEFHISQIWKFVKLSGYFTISLVLLFELINVYAIYYVENLRIELMIDNNPETIRQSMTKYLIINAALEMGRQQLQVLETWISNTLWSKKIAEQMRCNILNAILALPLTLAERIHRNSVYSIFIGDRYNISYRLPHTICRNLIRDILSTTSAVIQVYRNSPYLLSIATLPVALSFLVDRTFQSLFKRMWKLAWLHIYKPNYRLSMVLFESRSLLRIHGSVGQYVSRHKAITSAVLNYDIVSQSIRNSTILVIQVCSELIRTAVILYYLRKRLVSDVSTIPGEIDVKIGLTLKVFTRTANLANIGDRFNSSLEKLSRYYIYTEKLAREAPAVIEDNRPDSDWTSTGVIEFKDYSMRYNEDSDLVLKGLTFATRKHEKVGVVGRTGAGKSSLTYALMRMVESFGGQIIIDGIDISTIGLSDLRSRIAIIPQDPALFEGTIRDNLDPMNEYTDEQVMDAIDACQVAHLLDTPTEKYVEKDDDEDFDRGPWVEGVGLNKWVEYDGKNFSVGQRQLISLCRALLWRRSIVVLDEATANVDGETDGIMQEVIRKEFKDCTVLTIAHRLGTIMDSDRILVMDHGKVAEFDTPENLLADKDSQFSLLVESMKFNHRTKEDKE